MSSRTGGGPEEVRTVRKGIALAGNLILDHYKEIACYPAHSTLTTILGMRDSSGGAVCNSGMDLARLDPKLPLYAIGVVGDDDDGRHIVDAMSAYPNMDTSRIRRHGRTSYTDVFEDRSHQTRTFFQFRGANAELGPSDFDFDELPAAILHIGYLLLLDTLDQADPDYETVMARVLAAAQKAGIKTSIDIVTEESDRFGRLVPPALRYTDYCIINEEEASRTTGIAVRDASGAFNVRTAYRICEALFACGVRDTVILHAREGAVGIDCRGGRCHVTALDMKGEKLQSTTGAGDAFLAGSLYALYQGESLRSAMELGIGTSALSLLANTASDAVLPAPEVRAFFRAHKQEHWPGFGA